MALYLFLGGLSIVVAVVCRLRLGRSGCCCTKSCVVFVTVDVVVEWRGCGGGCVLRLFSCMIVEEVVIVVAWAACCVVVVFGSFLGSDIFGVS